MSIAALPMYDWPEARDEVDACWAGLRTRFLSAGIDAPETLARRNADLPAVPGGILDRDGLLIAADPATLPAGELDFPTLWKHPGLLFAQTCWGPMEEGLAKHVVVIGQPSYDGIEGGDGELYSSAILMRRGARQHPSGLPEGVKSPTSGKAILPLELLRNARFAFNGEDSMSGIIALTRDLEAIGESLAIFSVRAETGSHRASVIAVAQGRADVCAVDCLSWQLAQRHEPCAADVAVVGWTARRKGLPFITSRHRPPDAVARLRLVLSRQ
ncbi:MAG: PhnD/SsuA/transferrin family substrate-binding protein [Hyphomicrobiales bacterium]|nr:PhnD/SsuA/transferrin family substrate-binding protein [Hyphomicrobiales bacterium]